MASADELKALGNKAIADKNFDEAVAKFTEAIALQPENHILYSNRSAAYASKREWDSALADAEKTTEIKPDWAKGWGRKGAALHGKGDLLGANTAYEEGLKHDASNAQLKSGLASVEKAMQQEAAAGGDGGFPGGDPAAGLSRMFNDPGLLQKLAANPKTSGYMSDPSFMAKLEQLKKNPQMSPDMFSDPRMIQVLGVMMGVDMEMRDSDPREQQDTNMSHAPPAQSQPQAPKKAPEPEPEPEELDEEALEKKKAKEAADKEKALGTENYKKRNFDEAIQHYTKAWELFKDITYLNNLGAAQFEKGDYDACIAACTKAVEEGREIYADFKIIAKSYARVGTAYERKGDLASAIENYNRSLTEHRTPDVLNKLRAAEKSKKDGEKQAYIDPAKAEEAREEGNKKFKESDFPGAVACYSEMVKRAPEDPRGYSNRAAAFIKLFEFPSALDDCAMAVKKDPTFIRAYIRKAQAYFGMRKYSDCVDACTEAQQIDAEHHKGANAREIEQQQQKAFASMYTARDNETEEQTRERLMQDPEIMSIMQDPVMQSILQQAQSDPAALQEHMRNPGIKTKIQKLMAAGVIRVGSTRTRPESEPSSAPQPPTQPLQGLDGPLLSWHSRRHSGQASGGGDPLVYLLKLPPGPEGTAGAGDLALQQQQQPQTRLLKEQSLSVKMTADATWATLSTRDLLVELQRRQDGERPACGGKAQGWYDMAAHVFALFLILVLSTLACGFPLIGRRTTSGRRQSTLIFYCQHIGTGVLLATAFVHLLPTAFESLTDPCLPHFFSKGYTPLPGLIAMVSAIIVVGVESYLTARGAGHSHSHGHHGMWEDSDGEGEHGHEMNGLAERRGDNLRPADITVEDADAETTQGLVAGASPLPSSTPTNARSRKMSSDAAFHDGDSDLELDLDELDPEPQGSQGNSGQYASLTKPGHRRAESTDIPPQTPEQQQRQLLQCLLLEAGILFHSVFIGMALSVATGPAFIVFLIAISFHQSFEGLALGSRIAAVQFERKSIRPWLMVLAYGFTTPIGQAIGLVVHRIYDPASMGGLIVVGFMNAVSAGLLLYAGLVQLLAEDFLSEKSYKILKGKKRFHAYLAVVGGATLMAAVGAFA